MSSKLSYLSKYSSTDNNPSSHAKKEKKRKKKSKQHKSSKNNETIRDMDDISNLLKGRVEEEDDDPVVVVDAEVVESSYETIGSRRGFERVDDRSGAVQERRRRHDSDSEGLTYRNNGRATISRRVRHDSDSEGSSPKRDRRSKRRRHDSDSDASSPSRRKSHVQRRRHDSDSDDSTKHRKRHDSSSEEENTKATRHRHDSSDEEKPIKKRHDSDSDTNTKTKHHRYDSSSEDEPKMSSGHKSGLQSSSDFVRAERKIQSKKRQELSTLNKPTGGTIYRDGDGKKRSLPTGIDKSESQKKIEEEEKSRLLNMGTYQKQQEERVRDEFEAVKDMPLARSVDDVQMEERRRNVIREGDPMAVYAWKKQQEEQPTQHTTSGKTHLKPMYKGPPPKPNRYGIRPGYRWDGIDRGNGFEDRLLSNLHCQGRKKEEAYKWSSADM